MSQINQVFAAAAGTLGAFGLGTVLAWTSPALPNMGENSDRFKDLNSEETSWIGAILTVCIARCTCLWSSVWSVDGQNREKEYDAIALGTVRVGMAAYRFCQNLAMMLIGRFVSGFCGGGFSLVAPVYIGETAEYSIRGALGSGFQLMVVLGILFVNVLGAFVDWKWLALICGFVPLVFLIAMIFVPESPRYLLLKGKNAEASEALRWFRKRALEQDVEQELHVLESGVNEEKSQKATFAELLLPYNLKPALIMFGLMFFQQLSGINAVIFYTVEIFKDAGSELDKDVNVSSMIIGVVQVVATLASVFVVDKLGRRILLLVSDSIMCISLVLLGLYFKLDEDGSAQGVRWLPLVSLITFIIAFSIGYGPLPWMMLGELLPPKVKGLTATLATMFNWFLAFLVTKFFEDLLALENFGAAGCYWMFAGICGVGTVFVFIFVPETKGISIEEIQRGFGAPNETTANENNGDKNSL